MSFKATWFRDKLNKKAKRGFQSYPIATITYYAQTIDRQVKLLLGLFFKREAL